MKSILTELPEKPLYDFCQRWHVDELAIFGSMLHTPKPDSDVDLLVTFSPNAVPSLFEFIRMQRELEEIFDRKVDLVSRQGLEEDLNLDRACEIFNSAQTIYSTS